ncbi:MAG TPA: hypothetical protein PKL83_00805 [bacterium]|nr:hypothetical protein [bacterium]
MEKLCRIIWVKLLAALDTGSALFEAGGIDLGALTIHIAAVHKLQAPVTCHVHLGAHLGDVWTTGDIQSMTGFQAAWLIRLRFVVRGFRAVSTGRRPECP